MLENDYNLTDDSISQEPELSSGEGDVNESGDVLSIIEEATGRRYPDINEAKRALKETFGYVGKAGNYEKLVKTIAEKLDLGDEKGVKEWLENIEEKPTKTQSSANPVEEKVSELEFIIANPDLKPHLPFLKKLAKADGVSLEEAKNSDIFQDYLKTKSSQNESPNSIIESNRRVGFQDSLKPLVEEYKKTNSEEVGQKLVEKALGL